MDNSTTWNITITTTNIPRITSKQAYHAQSWVKEFHENTSFQIAVIPLYLLAVVFHTGGLYLLRTVRKRKPSTATTNDNLVSFTTTQLLVMLSVSQLSASLFIVIETVSRFVKLSLVSVIFGALWGISGGISLSTVYLMTLNRLVCTVYPFWYRRWLTKGKCVAVAVPVCVIVTCFAFGNYLINRILSIQSPTIVLIGRVIYHFIYDFYLVFCVFTYVVILTTISKSRRKSQVNNTDDSTSTTFQTLKRKGFITPFLITLSYMVFVIAPFLAMVTCSFYGCMVPAFEVWWVTFALNSMSDALIYVFFDRDIRTHLKKLINRRN